MSHDAPLLTVGIPTFNRAEFLAEAIDGVLAQTCGDFELLVSDNCSTDGTRELVEGYQDERVHYHRHEVALGPSENFASVAKRARGRYFVLHQDDDWIHTDFLERCRTSFESFPEATMYAAPLWYQSRNRGYTTQALRPPGGFSPDSIIKDEPFLVDGPRMAVRLLDPWMWSLHPAIALRRSVLEESGGYFVDNECSSDLVTFSRVLLRGSLIYDSRPGAIMRIHEENHSQVWKRSSRKKFFLRTYRSLIDSYEEFGVDWKSLLREELEDHTTGEVIHALSEWTYYSTSDELRRVGWEALQRVWPASKLKLYRKLVSGIGLKRTLRLFRSVRGS